MGFDLLMLEEPADSIAAYKPQFDGNPRYWRFVSAGMRVMSRIMLKAGILDVETPPPDWPWPPEGIPEDRVPEIEEWVFQDAEPEEEPNEEEKKILRPIREQIERVRRTRSNHPGKVPAFKFFTNDGWIVESDECTLIAEGLRAAVARSKGLFGLFSSALPSKRESGISKQEAEEWILNWAAYNELASRHGGYKVL